MASTAGPMTAERTDLILGVVAFFVLRKKEPALPAKTAEETKTPEKALGASEAAKAKATVAATPAAIAAPYRTPP